MRKRSANYLVVLLAGLLAIGFLSGLGGLLMVCHSSALIPANFHLNGNCHASDTPAEVAASFALLGLLLGAPLLITGIIAEMVRTKWGSR
ncbi:MAG: hypothetical protein WBP18_11315 [Paracoccaceae bacterium]